MSYSIVVFNGLGQDITVGTGGYLYDIEPGQREDLGRLNTGSKVLIDAEEPFTVQYNGAPIAVAQYGDAVGFITTGFGVYNVFPRGLAQNSTVISNNAIPAGQPSLKSIIDFVLLQNCPPDVAGCGYGGWGYTNPGMASWGTGNPCQLQKTYRTVNMLNTLYSSISYEQRVQALNTPVMTFIPNQGMGAVTILEAAIIMRMPQLTLQLLQMGASPWVTTSGVPLLTQLIDDYGDDWQSGTEGAEAQIINILLQFGAGPVPPGFAGTRGYGIDRPYPFLRNQVNQQFFNGGF